jgi:hypothetical protein
MISAYNEPTISLEDYKDLLGEGLAGKTDEEIRAWYECHTTFVSFVLKCWLCLAGKDNETCDKLSL